MANVKAVLVHPTTRADGTPFPLSELKHVVIETRADAATTWTAVGQPMTPSQTERTIQNVPGGVWRYRATWVDTADRASPAVEAVISIAVANPVGGTITLSVV